MSGGEFATIAWIRNRVRPPQSGIGIGDDAALLHHDGPLLVTVDMMMEGVHFEWTTATPRAVGRKLLAVNLSDIAAMAGQPSAAVLSLALPRHGGATIARELVEGIAPLADEFGVSLVGGDTNAWDGKLVVSLTLWGSPTGKGAVRRGGAQPGDAIVATGAFGGSREGHHLSFTPRVREAQALHACCDLHALIDVSDGLAADLGHICAASGCGARIRAAAVPISNAARLLADPLDHALHDGEDFELLAALPARDAERLLATPPCDTQLSIIGVFTAAPGLTLERDGACAPLLPRGYEHALGE